MVKRYIIPPHANGTPRTNEERLTYLVKQFKQDFPSERACADFLYSLLFPHGAKCRKCGKSNCTRRKGARKFQCNDCGTLTWITADTPFKRVKKLWPRLLFDTLTENGVHVSVLQFSKIAGIVYKTARKIFGMVSTVIESEMSHAFAVVPSKFFITTFYKRSTETPVKKHPSAEQKAMEVASFSKTPALQRKAVLIQLAAGLGKHGEAMREVYEALSPKNPMSEDKICQHTRLETGEVLASLFELELEKFIKQEPGGWILASLPQASKGLASNALPVKEFIEFVKTTFYGIARKYLQKYLAYWWYLKRQGLHSGLLIDKCLRFGRMKIEGLSRLYVTPLKVKLAV